MKWNDVRNNFQKSIHQVSTLSDKVRVESETPITEKQKVEHRKRNIMLVGIFAVIIIACIVLFFVVNISKKDKEQDPVTPEQAVFIGNFLEENPPEPVTVDQSNAIYQLLEGDNSQ